MKSISVSAPGKVLLMGDHAVVYGRPCLVTAVDYRLSLSMEISEDQKMHITTPPGVSDTRFLSHALVRAAEKWGKKLPGLVISTKSQFSGEYGLGSSAAVTVATIAALARLMEKKIQQKEVFEIAYRTILDIQGRGSGFDAASATFGGLLYFISEGKVMEPLSATAIPLVIGYTGTKADTVSQILEVEKKMKAQPKRVERIFDAVAGLVDDAKTKIEEGDWERVGRLMDFNQDYLRDLGVSSEKLETLISAAKSAGAWGAKLSGAGGGDCMIALAPKNKRASIEAAIERAGGQVIRATPCAQGVRVDE